MDRRVYLCQADITQSEEEAVQILQAQTRNDVHERFAELAGKHSNCSSRW